MSRLWAAARPLQQGGLYVLLFLLPFSKAAVELSFGLLLIGWVLERLNPATRAETVPPLDCMMRTEPAGAATASTSPK
jgi:hypothetical protein